VLGLQRQGGRRERHPGGLDHADLRRARPACVLRVGLAVWWSTAARLPARALTPLATPAVAAARRGYRRGRGHLPEPRLHQRSRGVRERAPRTSLAARDVNLHAHRRALGLAGAHRARGGAAMMAQVMALGAGLVFALGLGLAGMT